MVQPRLFVDCDDTLLLYDEGGVFNPYGFWKGDPYHINEPLVKLIKLFRKIYPDALIVIWSGGGQAYANEVMEAVGIGVSSEEFVDAIPMIKDRTTFHLVRKGDFVFDDEDIDVPAKVLRPKEI